VRLKIFRIFSRMCACIIILAMLGCFSTSGGAGRKDKEYTFSPSGGCSKRRVAIVGFKRTDKARGFFKSALGNKTAMRIATRFQRKMPNVLVVRPNSIKAFLNAYPYADEPDWGKMAREIKADYIIYGTIDNFNDGYNVLTRYYRGVMEGTVTVYIADSGTKWTRKTVAQYPHLDNPELEIRNVRDKREKIDEVTAITFSQKIFKLLRGWRCVVSAQ